MPDMIQVTTITYAVESITGALGIKWIVGSNPHQQHHVLSGVRNELTMVSYMSWARLVRAVLLPSWIPCFCSACKWVNH